MFYFYTLYICVNIIYNIIFLTKNVLAIKLTNHNYSYTLLELN